MKIVRFASPNYQCWQTGFAPVIGTYNKTPLEIYSYYRQLVYSIFSHAMQWKQLYRNPAALLLGIMFLQTNGLKLDNSST